MYIDHIELIEREVIFKMRVGNLDNYRTILYYSLITPGKSNIETFGLANKEFNLTPVSKVIKLKTNEVNGRTTNKQVEYPEQIQKDNHIRKLEAELHNMEGAYMDLGKNIANLPLHQQLNSLGQLIDIYV